MQDRTAIPNSTASSTRVVAPRLDLREIEHVIDHVEQVVAGFIDIGRVVDAVRGDLFERQITDQLGAVSQSTHWMKR
jgi:hypothetical protein